MSLAFDVVSWIAIGAGAAFCVIGGVGLLRFPDFFSRMHAAGVTDTLGAGAILFGLCVQSGLSLTTFKLLVIWAFLWLTSPTAGNALASAALARGLEPRLGPQTGGGSSSLK